MATMIRIEVWTATFSRFDTVRNRSDSTAKKATMTSRTSRTLP